MKQRDMDALQRDFSCLNKADFARLVTEVDAAPTSYARCNVIAAWRKRTHDLRETAIVEAHAVDGVLYGWSEIVEPVQAIDRMQSRWWDASSLWKELGAHRSYVEREALKNIQSVTVAVPEQTPQTTAELSWVDFRDLFFEVWDEVRAEDACSGVCENHRKPLREIHRKRGVHLEYVLNTDGAILPVEVALKAA